MAEMAGYDKHRAWDGIHSRSEIEPEPGVLEQAIVSVLRDLAGAGPASEIGVGGGRIAIPLAATGTDVDGIDFSPKAIDLLRSHPDGATVHATVADMTDFALDRRYQLIYCIGNVLFDVLSQDGQVRCFERVAAHLAPEGVFLLHSTYTPAWFERFRNGQLDESRHFEVGFAELQAMRLDPIEQLNYVQDISMTKDGIALRPGVKRYASIAELDLMARIAGLRRRELWGSWTREPFGALRRYGQDSPILLALYEPTGELSEGER
jgi:hypothetical protein